MIRMRQCKRCWQVLFDGNATAIRRQPEVISLRCGVQPEQICMRRSARTACVSGRPARISAGRTRPMIVLPGAPMAAATAQRQRILILNRLADRTLKVSLKKLLAFSRA